MPFFEDTIQEVLDEIRPLVLRDGGNIHLVRCIDGIVEVRLEGACITCPLSHYTLKIGILQQLKKRMPEIKDVIPVE
jgi:Fe-S cluster biogenesis protein NfuA